MVWLTYTVGRRARESFYASRCLFIEAWWYCYYQLRTKWLAPFEDAHHRSKILSSLKESESIGAYILIFSLLVYIPPSTKAHTSFLPWRPMPRNGRPLHQSNLLRLLCRSIFNSNIGELLLVVTPTVLIPPVVMIITITVIRHDAVMVAIITVKRRMKRAWHILHPRVMVLLRVVIR